MGVRIVVGEREAIGLALRRFRKQLERQGVLWEVRRRSHFVRNTEWRRAKAFRKRFKTREAVLHAQIMAGMSGPTLEKAKCEFWRRTGKK
jgi:small subunit ribosomal protein S21